MRSIGGATIRKRLKGYDITGQVRYVRASAAAADVKRILDIICEMRRHECTIIYGGGVLSFHKKNFEARIDILNPSFYVTYDAVLMDFIKELI